MKNKILNKIPWKIIFNFIIIILTIILVVYFIFSEGGFIDLINSGLKINTTWIIIAIFMHILNIGIDSAIIYLFVKQTTPNVRFYEAFITSMVGQFFCSITPSSSGGQPMQILTMSRMGIKGANATSALIQKFLVWQFTLTAYSVIAVCARFSFFANTLSPLMWTFAIFGFLGQILMIVALLLASFCKNITSKIVCGIFSFFGSIRLMKNVEEKKMSFNNQLNSFHENNKNLNKNKTLLTKVYVLTAVQMTAYFLIPYCIAMSFNISCNIFDMLCAQSYVNMVSSLVPLPGGSGAAEYSFSAFFASYFSPETMKSAILLWRTITYYGTIAISAPFARFRQKSENKETSTTVN